jgi:hypothetical protein
MTCSSAGSAKLSSSRQPGDLTPRWQRRDINEFFGRVPVQLDGIGNDAPISNMAT